MPELPEVETVRRTLLPAVGRRVTGVWTSGKALRLGSRVDERALSAATVGARLEGVRRWGKHLLLDFRDRDDSLLVHLGMSGRLRLCRQSEATAPHTHVVFDLDRGQLRFSDPRRFGDVALVRRGAEVEHRALRSLGVDALDGPLTGEHLHGAARRSGRAIKLILLDQSVVAGIGNIYASEALWQARISPTLPGARLSRPRADQLAGAVVEVLRRALEHGGTSLRDFVAADGAAGEHRHYLWVYDREGEPCRRCRRPIRRRVLQARATYYCPRCQPR